MNKRWYNSYLIAKDYYLNNNDLLPGYHTYYKGFYLGKWVVRQRQLQKQGKLSLTKKNLLDEIKMVWDLREYHWQKNFQIVKEYYDKFHNLHLPAEYLQQSMWLANQKQLYVKNKLPKDHEVLLNSIGIKEVSPRNKWQDNFALAKTYYEQHGNLLVPKDYKIGSVNLRNWINNQRKAYKDNRLSEERINKLNSIGMIWSVNEYKKQEAFKYIEKYYQKHGNLFVLPNYVIDGFNLGKYLKNQRILYHNQQIDLDIKKRLDEYHYQWNLDSKWYYKYLLAKDYFQKHGNLLIPYHYVVDNIKLGFWIHTQRNNYRENKLSSTQVALLNEIKMVWNAQNERFNNKKLDDINNLKQVRFRLTTLLNEVLNEYNQTANLSEVQDDIAQRVRQKL